MRAFSPKPDGKPRLEYPEMTSGIFPTDLTPVAKPIYLNNGNKPFKTPVT